MCPNIAECWGKHRTATFMILGDICTRACAFCAVTSGRPTEYDLMEPARVAAAIADLRLKTRRHHVGRSRRPEGRRRHRSLPKRFREIRKLDPNVKIELLTPDFQGSLDSVQNDYRCGSGHLLAQHRDRAAAVSIDSVQVGLHDFVRFAESSERNGFEASSSRPESWLDLVKKRTKSSN